MHERNGGQGSDPFYDTLRKSFLFAKKWSDIFTMRVEVRFLCGKALSEEMLLVKMETCRFAYSNASTDYDKCEEAKRSCYKRMITLQIRRTM